MSEAKSDLTVLLWCPFCGSTAEIESTTFGDSMIEYYRACCTGVSSHSLDCWSDSPADAAVEWNLRTPFLP